MTFGALDLISFVRSPAIAVGGNRTNVQLVRCSAVVSRQSLPFPCLVFYSVSICLYAYLSHFSHRETNALMQIMHSLWTWPTPSHDMASSSLTFRRHFPLHLPPHRPPLDSTTYFPHSASVAACISSHIFCG